jgi:uncharacterized protein DUF547
MRSIALLSGWLLLAAAAQAQGFDHAHKAWDALLKKHVVLIDGGKASQMRYAGMAQDRAALKAYLDGLSRVTEGQFKDWSRPQQMAFLVNAYNAFTVEKILTRYPNIQSIWDFGKIFGNPFKDQFFTLLGRKASLDGIEHDTLRKSYQEPRVHYAVNCASIGCPMLREEAYVAERLEAQLEQQAERFLSDRSRNRYSAQTGRLEVSEIFKWFREDWESGYQGIRSREQYFATYAKLLADNAEQQTLVAEGKARLVFLDYDWSLNDAKQ